MHRPHPLPSTLAVAFVLVTGDAVARAAPHVDTVLIRDGKDAGEVNRGADGRDQPRQAVYPGGEQAQMAQLASGDLLLFGMGSYRLNGALPPNRNQMFCAEIHLDPTAGPQVTTLKYVTSNNGDRYRNAHHPRVTSIFGGEAVAVTYNYAPDNLAYAYQTVFGPGCAALSERTQIVAKDNDNCSETGPQAEIVSYQDATTARLFSVHGCNGNGSDDSWAAITEVRKLGPGQYQVVAVTDDIRTEAEEERSRPEVIATSAPDLAVVCLTAGNTQPPDRGVYCSGYDSRTGQALWRQAVAEKTGDVYRTQIRVRPILDAAGAPTDQAYVTWQELTQRNRKGKGTARLMAAVVRLGRDGMSIEAVPQTDVYPGGDATHASQCTTRWGTDGVVESRLVLVSGSTNGNPAALSSAHIIGWDRTGRELFHELKLNLGAAIDNGWLSNLYGENPTTQGRNYIQCLGDIRNPGYQVTGGYQADVKSFIAVAAHTRRIDGATGLPEDKLATELVLVPAVVAPGAPPPGDAGDDTDDPDPGSPADGPEHSGGIGACGVTGGGGTAGALLALALALVVAGRRRRRW
ncbi:MAG TPA: MYXO-CTERM sorting domain-containing protein [Kofleriaceae bacterium]|nr:MYXO-CTERM sorting domain-containing protein [Kofleriaceae bacterium]